MLIKGRFRRYDFCLGLSCATSIRHDFTSDSVSAQKNAEFSLWFPRVFPQEIAAVIGQKREWTPNIVYIVRCVTPPGFIWGFRPTTSRVSEQHSWLRFEPRPFSMTGRNILSNWHAFKAARGLIFIYCELEMTFYYKTGSINVNERTFKMFGKSEYMAQIRPNGQIIIS